MVVVDGALLVLLFIMCLWGGELVPAIEGRVEENKMLSKEMTTALKGLSAFLVIAAHTHNWMKPEITSSTIDKFNDLVLTQLGGIGVLVFFFLSGYGIQEGYGHKSVGKSYILKRLRNVIVPYVVLKLIFLFVDLLIGSDSISNIGFRFLRIITFEDWFIFVVVIEYTFYFVARRIMKEKHIAFMILMNIALAILFIFQNRADRYINSMWLFIFGVLISKYQKVLMDLSQRHYYLVLISSLLVFLFMGAIFAIYKGVLWADFFKPISGMALCVFLMMTMRMISIKSPFLMWGGRGRFTFILLIYVYLICA